MSWPNWLIENDIGEEGAKNLSGQTSWFSKGLKSNSSLKSLNLSGKKEMNEWSFNDMTMKMIK